MRVELGVECLIAEDRVPQDVLESIYADYGQRKFALSIAMDGAFTHDREYDPVEEAIDAIGHALALKREHPDSVISIVVGFADDDSLVVAGRRPR